MTPQAPTCTYKANTGLNSVWSIVFPICWYRLTPLIQLQFVMNTAAWNVVYTLRWETAHTGTATTRIPPLSPVYANVTSSGGRHGWSRAFTTWTYIPCTVVWLICIACFIWAIVFKHAKGIQEPNYAEEISNCAWGKADVYIYKEFKTKPCSLLRRFRRRWENNIKIDIKWM
jgi:hypothetical protein